MIQLLGRKLLLLLALAPLFNALGFYIGVRLIPSFRPTAPTFTRNADGTLTITQNFEELDLPPFWEMYGGYLGRVSQGEWGTFQTQPLTTLLAAPLRASLILLLLALVLTMTLGPLLGFAAISRRTQRVGRLGTAILTIGASFPSYLFATAAIVILIYTGRRLGIPIRNYVPWQGYGLDMHLLLPTLALAVRPVFYIARITSGLLEHELQQDYVRIARGKGVPPGLILRRHALPNIASPVIVSSGQAIRMLVSQLIIVEAIFNWPGIGRLFLLTIGIRTDGGDANPFFGQPEIIAALALIFTLLLLIVDTLASLLAHRADPRLYRPADTPATA
jgi:peptide/nickel transport system permease protein